MTTQNWQKSNAKTPQKQQIPDVNSGKLYETYIRILGQLYTPTGTSHFFNGTSHFYQVSGPGLVTEK